MKMEFFKKKNNFNKKGYGLSPNLYWKGTVIVAFIIILLSFVFAYHLFVNIDQDSEVPTSAPDTTQTPKIDNARLQKALNYFSNRQNTSTQILSQPAPVVDPAR